MLNLKKLENGYFEVYREIQNQLSNTDNLKKN